MYIKNKPWKPGKDNFSWDGQWTFKKKEALETMGCIPQHQWIRKKNLQFLSQLTGVRGNWSLRSCPSSGSSSCSTSHSTEDNGWWQSWSELMPMTKNNDNPTSTLCENKKLLTIKLKLVTQANPARNLSCPQWHLRSPLQLSTKGGNNEKTQT